MVPGPVSSSTRPGRGTAPARVTRRGPGDDGAPSEFHATAPMRAATASWTTVSALETTVGRPDGPSTARGRVVNLGRASPPSTNEATAEDSPAT